MLRVLDRFPGANVKVIGVHDKAREVLFTAEPRGGTEALWFDFRITDTDPTTTEAVKLSLMFFRTLFGGNNPMLCRPVIREQGKNWQRLKPPEVTTSPDGQQSLSWIIPAPVSPVEVAFSFPFGRDELSTLLDHCKGYWTETPIGLSAGGRTITRLSNGVLNDSRACPNPRGLYIVTRQHAGETPGSWVMDGILEAISRAKPANWCVWAIPFANIDDVGSGAYGKDEYPYDLNNGWGTPPMRRESAVIQHDLNAWRERCRPELILDLHAPGACDKDGVFVTKHSIERSETEKSVNAWINIFRQALSPDYAAEDFSREVTCKSRWSGYSLEEYACNTLECPCFSVETPYAQIRDTILLQKHYREIGQKIARAILTRW